MGRTIRALVAIALVGIGCRTQPWDLTAPGGEIPVDLAAPVDTARPGDAACGRDCAGGPGLGVGAFHTCAWFGDGSLWCWGANDKGQLGLGTVSMGEPRPARVAAVDGVRQVTLGWAHTCALRRDGMVVCWGANDRGQLGRGAISPFELTPAAVVDSADVVELASGLEYTCARRADGSVWCWGANDDGQLGLGLLSPHVSSPHRRTIQLDGVQQLAGGRFHACARMSDDTVRCWGHTAVRQAVPDDAVPARVPGLDGVRHIGAGFTTSCAALGDGSVRCWGDRDRPPTAVAGIDRTIAVDYGAFHGCGLRTDGTVWCWGQNAFGELGIGTRGPNQPPTEVRDLGPVTELGVTNAHTCVREASGTIWCWGPNASGANGDGSFRDAAAPVRVLFP